ncbi:MAG: endonuclease/exonuclease/phosphatase family protein [Cellvibrionaceae bacterium]
MKNHYVAFWNLENLFAPQNHPEREPWLEAKLKKDLKGWTKTLFKKKIKQLTSIIVQMNEGDGPDILAVCEVENAFVLEQLSIALNNQFSERHYSVAHADNERDQRGIDTAFIFDSSMYSVDPATIFSHFVMRRTGTRDISQATFTTQAGNELVALCNHWPSRSGGAHESRGYRMTAGETLSYWHQRIWEEKGSDVPIIAVGDFNDDVFDESLVIHARATRERGDVERAKTAPKFYNLTWRYLEQKSKDKKGDDKLIHGTIYYQGNGNVFDQILVSKGLLDPSGNMVVNENTAKIELFPEMVDHRVSYGSIRFGLPKGDAEKNIDQSGFSDHFPVSVVIVES